MSQGHKPKYSSGKQSGGSGAIILGLVIVMAVLVAFSLGLRLLLGSSSSQSSQLAATAPVQQEPEEPKQSLWNRLFGSKEVETQPPPTQPEPEHVVSQATIAVTGDILMHMPVINTGLQSDGRYNFDSIFQYLTPYSSGADYSVANLETTLCGTDMGYKYSGYPAFNCPDEIVDALKNAGFDMLLTANNHCYDTSEYGFLRTVRTVRSKGLTALGTRESQSDTAYTIQEINGIQVGMVCYTYEGQPDNPTAGTVYMNKNALSANCAPLINSFLATQLDPFYMEARQVLTQMKQSGAEATVMYIHWGNEYQTTPSTEQQQIAQQLCDLGFDVIVGGHPHVIQPVSLLTSRLEPGHKTVCLYSTGNAVSNQRIQEMDLKTGHTEDGLLFRFTFSKYSDGTVYLEDADVLPCWVDMRAVDGGKQYDIIPLDASIRDQWQTVFGLTEDAYANAQKSYSRTQALVGDGIAQVQDYLSAQKQQREADYLAAVAPETQAA